VSDVEAIKAKIRALRQMTTARGCTEAEALAAAAKVAELLAAYDLTEDEAALADSAPIEVPEVQLQAPYSLLWYAVGRICRATVRAEAYWTGRRYARRVRYRAGEPDMLLAEYLHTVLARAIKGARAEFRASREYRRRRLRKTRDQAMAAFLEGFCTRLFFKLIEVFEERWCAAAATDQVERSEDEAESLPPSKAEKRRQRRERAIYEHPAYRAGRHAASRVELRQGVDDEDAGPRLLGRREGS